MMKRLLFILCALVVASSLWAYDFTAVAPDGNTYAYTITSDTVPRTVAISGANTEYQKIDIPVTVTYNENVYTVTGVGYFSNCRSVTSVSIPTTVKNFKSLAFNNCTDLIELNYNAIDATVIRDSYSSYNVFGRNISKLTIGSTVESLPVGFVSDNNKLTSVIIPASVKSIGANAFSNSGLITINVPASVKSIGENAFLGCISLTELNYNAVNATVLGGSSNPSIAFGTNLTKLTIGSTVESLPAYFVYGNSKLTSVTIPTSVKSIGASAFSNTGLTTIVLPNSIETIQSNTFSSCIALTSATIPATVKSIGQEAFCHTGLTSVTIPVSVKSIGQGAFRGSTNLHTFTYLGSSSTTEFGILAGCPALKTVQAPADAFSYIHEMGSLDISALENITITNGALTSEGLDQIRLSYRSLKSIDLAQASNTALPDVALENCYKLEQLVLPTGLETIGYKSFAECVMLKKVNVPASVTVVGDRAFENCRRMDTLTFGSSLKASSALQVIGNWAFYNCHNLKSLIVPEGVTEIGLAAFYGCSYVEQLTLPSSLLKIGDNSFALCSSLKSITVLAEAPPVIEAQTFYDVNRAIPVLVPESTIGLYAIDTYWSEFVGIAATDPTTNPTTGLADASVRPYRITVENGELVIDNPTNLPVSVYDMQGRSVGRSVAPQLTNGLYIVKIGDFTETIQ